MKGKTPKTGGTARIVFLFDVDNTLLDNDGVTAELADVEDRYPADHYVMVDDKLRILAAVRKIWGRQVTTVFVRQGHYALDPKILAAYPAADLAIERIGDLMTYDCKTLLPLGRALPAAPTTIPT